MPTRAPRRCTTQGCSRTQVSGGSKCKPCLLRAERALAQQRGTTTERGLGAAHQGERAHALTNLIEGTLCARCGQPMYRTQALDLDEYPVPRKQGGTSSRLAHARCNRAAGGRIATRTPAKRRRF